MRMILASIFRRQEEYPPVVCNREILRKKRILVGIEFRHTQTTQTGMSVLPWIHRISMLSLD